MLNIFLRKIPVPIFALGGFFLNIGRCETTSYTHANTVITSSSPILLWSSPITHLIDGTYKSIVIMDNSIGPPAPGYADYSKYFKFDIGTSKYIKTVFVCVHFWY